MSDESPGAKMRRILDMTAPIVPVDIERVTCRHCNMILLVQCDICPACGHCPICGKLTYHPKHICKGK